MVKIETKAENRQSEMIARSFRMSNLPFLVVYMHGKSMVPISAMRNN